jgi:S-(hydroxymethyl)glutathione dehydrogenase / alcohol dehydrogenase
MVTYPLTFKAAVLEKNNAPLIFREITFKGPLKPGQVLVKLYFTGICGKQIEEIDGLGGPDAFIPHLLGHEATGIVMDVGPGVKKVNTDDSVILHWMKGSGMQSETPLYNLGDERINAGWVTTFNEYAIVSENRVTAIPADSDMESSPLFGCAVTTGAGAIFNDANIKPHHSVVVYGCGGVGLFVIQAAKVMSPKQIIAVDINEEALTLAKKFGATSMVNASKLDPIKEVKRLTNGKGAERVIIITGNKQAIETAIETASIPGECIQVGVPVVGEEISINGHALMHKRNISGSLGGSTFPDIDIPAYMNLNDCGKLNVKGLITKVLPFEQINEGIDFVRGQNPGRVIVKFEN